MTFNSRTPTSLYSKPSRNSTTWIFSSSATRAPAKPLSSTSKVHDMLVWFLFHLRLFQFLRFRNELALLLFFLTNIYVVFAWYHKKYFITINFYLNPKKTIYVFYDPQKNMEPINFIDCFICAYRKRKNQNLQHVNKIDPRYSDTLCANCVVLVDEDFDRNSMDRNEYLRTLFQKRMVQRSQPFAVWSQNPQIRKWHPMNDDATHWRCCTATKDNVKFEDFYINAVESMPPISRQETEVNNS